MQPNTSERSRQNTGPEYTRPFQPFQPFQPFEFNPFHATAFRQPLDPFSQFHHSPFGFTDPIFDHLNSHFIREQVHFSDRNDDFGAFIVPPGIYHPVQPPSSSNMRRRELGRSYGHSRRFSSTTINGVTYTTSTETDAQVILN